MPIPSFERLQLDDFVTTAITLGRQVERQLPGERLLPTVLNPLGTQVVTYIEHGVEHLQHFDTERGPAAEFGKSTFSHQKRTARMKRFGHAHERDLEEFPTAHPALRLRQKATAYPRRIVRQDLEMRKSVLVQDPASYDEVVTIGGGAEWDSAGGDPRADIRLAANFISGVTGVEASEMTLFLSRTSADAALHSPAFQDLRATFTADMPDLSRFARYVGIKDAWQANPQVALDDLSGTEDVYGDIGVLYIESTDSRILQRFDTSMGDNMTWAVDWSVRGGFATQVQIPERTATMWAWSQWSLPAVINSGAAVLIENISASV